MSNTSNITIGHGKTVHLADESINGDGEAMYFTRCGSDHATNRSMRTYRHTSRPVTCKKCLAKIDIQNRWQAVQEHVEKKIFALVNFDGDEHFTKMTATKQGGHWLIGGDTPQAIRSLGASISIVSGDMIYGLNGNRLVGGDRFNESDYIIK